MRNPLREICTVGSVREELPGEPRWTYSGTKLETADTAKESLQLPGLLYSELVIATDPENFSICFPQLRCSIRTSLPLSTLLARRVLAEFVEHRLCNLAPWPCARLSVAKTNQHRFPKWDHKPPMAFI